MTGERIELENKEEETKRGKRREGEYMVGERSEERNVEEDERELGTENEEGKGG